MFRFPLRTFLVAVVLGSAAVVSTCPGQPVDLRKKTVSSSRQFVVYCEDPAVRSRVASFAEDVKGEFLKLLGEYDSARKHPIIVTIAPVTPENAALPPLSFGVFGFDGGFKIQIDVRLGDNPAGSNFQRQIVRALMIEYAYRNKPEAFGSDVAYSEPPWWLIEGAVQMSRRRDTGIDTEFFRRLVEVNRLPPIEQFLSEKPKDFAETAQAIDHACAMCLVQLLVEQPNGRANLARLLRRLPDGLPDPVALLTKEFPALSTEKSLQRWWTLNLARFSAADRYKGLTPEETDAQLSLLLHFDLPVGKEGSQRTYTVDQFDQYLKNPASRAALLHRQSAIVTLSTQGSALYRPVLAEYEQIFSLLARGKTRGIKDRIKKVEGYRENVLKRTADIADFMNWYEATQIASRSDAFEGYMKVANELETPLRKSDPISTYLDEVAQEY
jgi:hypothetical protein